MTLKDLNEITKKMGIDKDKPIEICLPNGDFVWNINLVKNKDGGLYIFPQV